MGYFITVEPNVYVFAEDIHPAGGSNEEPGEENTAGPN